MATSSSVVIKVKHGDVLRRFSAPIADEKLMLNMDGLRKKIHSLFSFASDTELMLTYIDEDSDVVALVDDDDLCDVVKQGLNPLRITVNLNDEKNGSQYHDSSTSSTPLRSPQAQQPLPNLNAGISEILVKVPEPLRETLVKLSDDLASKVSSSAPGISELVDVFSKVGLSYLGKASESQTGAKSGAPENNAAAAMESKNSEYLEKLGSEANLESNKVKSKNVAWQTTKASSFDFNAVAAALDKQNDNVSSLEPEDPVLDAHRAMYMGMKKKAMKAKLLKKHFPLVFDKNITEKGVGNASRHKPGGGSFSASDPTTGDHVNGKTRSCGKSPMPIWAPPVGASKFGGPIEKYDCSSIESFLDNVSSAPMLPARDQVCFSGDVGQNDGSGGNVFHRSVRCDGCGIHPIVGPRFKSKVKVDYDLCHICFEEMGNSNDYIRMDRPAVLQPMPSTGFADVGRTRYQPMPHVFRGPRCKIGTVKLDSHFVQDVNIFDGTVMAPSTPFTKIWRMRNNGTLPWPPKMQLVWIGGDKLSNALSVEVQIPAACLLIDQELDIAVDFISPELPGRYISYWRMASPSGHKFGQRVWVLIQVDASVKEMPHETIRNLNLNLPPVCTSLTGPEIINVQPEQLVVDALPATANNLKNALESGKPETDQELKFPINDSLLVGGRASMSIPSSSASPAASYPTIDPSVMVPSPPSPFPEILYKIPPPPPPATFGSVAQSNADLPGKDEVEEKLLRELEEMGFRHVDLNKEVLRMNEYDLEQSVDDLCGVAEWDPILEELEEMGFKDTEMNKKLLQKNNGSIKHVVMDLIAGEKF